MTIPFLDLFKKLTGRSASVITEPNAAAAPARVVKKPAGERLSKTVLPCDPLFFPARSIPKRGRRNVRAHERAAT